VYNKSKKSLHRRKNPRTKFNGFMDHLNRFMDVINTPGEFLHFRVGSMKLLQADSMTRVHVQQLQVDSIETLTYVCTGEFIFLQD
jgi:hypothetical protein